MIAVNHGVPDKSTIDYSTGNPMDTLPEMGEASTLSERLRKACELAGFGPEGDSAASRRAIMDKTGMSKMGVSKLFSGKSAEPTVMNLFLMADLLKVDARWLGTGFGAPRQSALPSDAIEVAAKLSAIQDANARRAAMQAALMLAGNPMGQIANFMGSIAESMRWDPEVRELADKLQSLEDGPLRSRAIAKAMTAAFNPGRPSKKRIRDEQPAENPAVPATRKRAPKP